MRIEVYYRRIEEEISDSKIVRYYNLAFDKRTTYVGKISGSLYMIDESVLHFREFVDTEGGISKIKYSYHYQDRSNIRIFRYDNVEHHFHISTFPHHKHVGEKRVPDEIVQASEPQLREILEEIERVVNIRL